MPLSRVNMWRLGLYIDLLIFFGHVWAGGKNCIEYSSMWGM